MALTKKYLAGYSDWKELNTKLKIPNFMSVIHHIFPLNMWQAVSILLQCQSYEGRPTLRLRIDHWCQTEAVAEYPQNDSVRDPIRSFLKVCGITSPSLTPQPQSQGWVINDLLTAWPSHAEDLSEQTHAAININKTQTPKLRSFWLYSWLCHSVRALA